MTDPTDLPILRSRKELLQEIGRLHGVIDQLNEELYLCKADGAKMVKIIREVEKRQRMFIIAPEINEKLWQPPEGAQ